MNAPFVRAQDARTVAVSLAADGLARRAFTIADLENMAEAGIIDRDERLELVGGEIVPMAAKGARHETIKAAITRVWGRNCPDEFAFAQETALRLDPYNYFEPDFIGFSHGVRLADVKGSDVLLAVEVADSSLDYDLGKKPAIYGAFGVRELWVIDAKKRVVHVHREPNADGYARVSTHTAKEKLTPIEAPAELGLSLAALPKL